jgi:hypothetical protein
MARSGNPNGNIRIDASVINGIREMFKHRPVKDILLAFPDISKSHIYYIVKNERRSHEK